MDTLSDQITTALSRYDQDQNLGLLIDALRGVSKTADLDALVAATEPFKDRLEVVMPIYEHVVAQRPHDARAMVILANAYWLTGRGPDVVGDLAERAKSADASNRAAWHLWALAEGSVRARVERWTVVAARFPEDQLARAALADNAASLAGAEHDPIALDVALTTYEHLLRDAESPTQQRALEQAIATLRNWKL